MDTKKDYLKMIRDGESLTANQQIAMIVRLSIPAVMAQLTNTMMSYIDASMVGKLGANGSASIGLVASSTWLMGVIAGATGTGFAIQVAQSIGAKREKEARGLVRLGLMTVFLVALCVLTFCLSIAGKLPVWLGGTEDICRTATQYFTIYALFNPIAQLSTASAGMLQASGDMRTPSILQMSMCFMDVIFNRFLIYETTAVSLFGLQLTIPGAGLGVAGAALGTGLAQLVCASCMITMLLLRSPMLHVRKGDKLENVKPYLLREVKLALPMAVENGILCGAQIMVTRIVAPLGTISVAANSLSVTAEAFCYMPASGIAAAGTTLIGQSYGANRKDLVHKVGRLTVFFGMLVMTASGALLYIFAPHIIGLLTPVEEVRALGTMVLRIEAFAEPFYGAAIVCTGVMRGAGDTLLPSIYGFISMWAVRLPIAAYLAPKIGLRGVWIAMAVELTVRGIMLLIRLFRGRWSKIEQPELNRT